MIVTVPSRICREQLRALELAGWPRRKLAVELGLPLHAVGGPYRHQQTELGCALRIQEFYLSQFPERADDEEEELYTEELGQPDESVIERVLAGEDLPMTPLERIEVVRRLAERGATLSAIQRHLRRRISGTRLRQIIPR